jgi:hypothetical protein
VTVKDAWNVVDRRADVAKNNGPRQNPVELPCVSCRLHRRGTWVETGRVKKEWVALAFA